MALTVSNRCVEDAQAETGKPLRRREQRFPVSSTIRHLKFPFPGAAIARFQACQDV